MRRGTTAPVLFFSPDVVAREGDAKQQAIYRTST
jgi:hypothetical protein